MCWEAQQGHWTRPVGSQARTWRWSIQPLAAVGEAGSTAPNCLRVDGHDRWIVLGPESARSSPAAAEHRHGCEPEDAPRVDEHRAVSDWRLAPLKPVSY